MRRIPAETLLLATVVVWSFHFTAIRYALTHGFAPLTYAGLRWLLAAATLVAIALLRSERLRAARRDLGLLVVAALVGIVANQIAFAYAVERITASTVALVFGTLPIFIGLVAHVSGVERLKARHWLATAVSFSGVALIAAGGRGGLSASLAGIALALVATSSFALFSVMVVPIMRRNSPIAVNAITAVVGAIGLTAAAGTTVAGETWDDTNGLTWAALVYGAVISIGLGNVLWFTAIDRVGPGRASLFANLQPFLGAVFAVLVLSESLRAAQIAGGFVIAAGIVLGHGARIAPAASE